MKTPVIAPLLRLPDGRSVRVSTPEFMAISPDWREAWVWEQSGSGHRIDLLLVSDIEFERRRRGRRSA